MTELTYNEADFLMHCIEVWADGKEEPFLNASGDGVALTFDQINELFLRLQTARRAASRWP